jgi:hypothetical protein
MAADNETPEELVPVFHTADPGLLPLAELALRNAQIEYVVRRSLLIPPALLEKRTDFANPADPSDIIVRAEDAARARELLAELGTAEQLAEQHQLDPTAAEWQSVGPPPILLSDIDAGTDVGRVSERHLAEIADVLEEDDETPQAYYITSATIDLLQESGVDPATISLLRFALGDRDAFLLRWQKIDE